MLWLADAYAEGSVALCKALLDDDYTRQFTSSRVVLHLCRHAAELFLKGAIGVRAGSIPTKTHRLDRLYPRYKELFPLEKHHIDLPFPGEAFESSAGLFPGSLEDYQRTHDQRFRYPTDNKGQSFVERENFDVIAFQASAKRFGSQVNLMVARLAFDWEL
jgi:hypothetical protein